jgi:hypothetical protein
LHIAVLQILSNARQDGAVDTKLIRDLQTIEMLVGQVKIPISELMEPEKPVFTPPPREEPSDNVMML